MREIRRRTRVVGAFPDGNSALMLVAARLRHIAGTKWGSKRFSPASPSARLLSDCAGNLLITGPVNQAQTGFRHARRTIFQRLPTATANDIEPYDYLKYLLENIAAADTVEAYEALLPWNMK